MDEYHALKHLLRDGARRLDADKTERIIEVLSRAYQEIESIIRE